MFLVNRDQMRRYEQAADAAGLSYAEMMHRAGSAVAELVHERFPAKRIAVLAGPGNNGGDALVAAAQLAQHGHGVSVMCCRRDVTGDPLIAPLRELGVPVAVVEAASDLGVWRAALAEAEVALDGLLGTGARLPIEGLFREALAVLLEAQAARNLSVVAVDVPSGLNCDTGAVDASTVPADLTVTFGFPKIGQLTLPGAEYVGQLIVDNIGIQATEEVSLTVTTAGDAAGWLPSRPLGAHKGTFGRVLVVGGSAPYTGAAYLAAAAAYRAGCGLVTAAVPESLHPVVAARVPEATFLLLPEDLGVIARSAAGLVAEVAGSYQAILLGPGMTTERPAAEFLCRLLEQRCGVPRTSVGFGQPSPADRPSSTAAEDEGERKPPVLTREAPKHDGSSAAEWPRSWIVDADGLNLLARAEGLLDRLPKPSVLTPHPGEMARLLGSSAAEVNADRLGAAGQAAVAWGHIVLLKGAFTVVAAPDGRLAVNPFAEPALARAGTGDVLAGLVAGFAAQGLGGFEAARLAAYVHGRAGQRAAEAIGRRSTVAGDVLAQVAGALRELEALADGAGCRVVVLRSP